MNKRLLALITSSAILIGACGSGTGSNNSNNNDSPRVTTPDIRDEQAYLDYIADESPIHYLAVSNEELIATGETVCESLDEGMPLEDLVDIAEESLSPDVTATFIVGAASYLCPEHYQSVFDQAQNNGWLS